MLFEEGSYKSVILWDGKIKNYIIDNVLIIFFRKSDW